MSDRAVALAIAQLKIDEGCRLTAYPDPISHGAPWTIGYGCTGDDIAPGVVWTQQQADAALTNRVGGLAIALANALPWVVKLDDVRRSVLINMAYNLGLSGLLACHATLGLIRAGDYAGAADHMVLLPWAREVGARARRLAVRMRTGAQPEPI